MIYTITLNPALDYFIHADKLVVGGINCNKGEELRAGGKGINVSAMLHTLGTESTAIALVAGETGKIIEQAVKALGVKTDFIHLDSGHTRINVKITATESTAFNGRGPVIDERIIPTIMERLDPLGSDDLVVIAGSLPSTAPTSLYVDLLHSIKRSKPSVIIDTAGNLLADLLPFRPLLIKPNSDELGAYFGTHMQGTEDIIHHAGVLQREGARNVLVSRGSEGSILMAEDGRVFKGNSPGGTVVNTVGCGDSMVAGFIAGYLRHCDVAEGYRLSIAASSAKAVCTTAVTAEFVKEMEKKVTITEVNRCCTRTAWA